MEPSQPLEAAHDATPRETRLVVSPRSSDGDDEWRRVQSTLRQSEKRSRARRAGKILTMRQQVEALERVQCVLPLLTDADALWDEFLDEPLRETRVWVRRLLPAAREAQRLQRERVWIIQLVQERELLASVLRSHIDAIRTEERGANDWHRLEQKWRALAHAHFRPWTVDECERELERATNEMNRFMLSNDKQSTGLAFMGWQDSRRIDPKSSRFQFTLHKAFHGFDIDHYAHTSWRAYTEQDLYSEIIFGGRAKLSLDILQQVSPTMFLIRYVESYDDRPMHIHRVYLVARVPTEDGGVVQYMRSVAMPAIQRAICEPNDIWAALDFYWMRWDLLDAAGAAQATDRRSTNFRVSLGGTLYLEDLAYLQYWLFALVGAIVRSEALSTRRPLLEF